MRRLTLPERADWQARAESLGFTWHHDSGQPYWDDAAAYALTLEQVEAGVEVPSAEPVSYRHLTLPTKRIV